MPSRPTYIPRRAENWGARDPERRRAERSALPTHAVLRLQATAGNRAVSRMLARRAVQRMKIGGVEYKRGDTVKFSAAYLAAKKRKLDAGELRKRFGTDEAGFNVLFNVLATGTADFADLDDFIKEMNIMRRDWGAQKLFYEKPGSLTEELGDVQGQEANRTITLYSARGKEKVQRILWWALQNNIPVEGFDRQRDFRFLMPGDARIDAPFKGHFGDRSHTVKHIRQKSGYLISIVLNPAGSKALTDLKDDPASLKKGAEGYKRGAFGLKTEADFVSVAIGESADTWDYLKDRIQKIRLHQSDTKGPADFRTDKKRTGVAPERIPGVGRVVDVPGTGMNCLIRAIYRAINIHIDDAQVGLIRFHLQQQGVAGAANPLNLAGAAGAVLVTFLVQQGVINANRGIEVYDAAHLQNPHVVVNGAVGTQPIRLWLSGGHFQAILPG
jgi:hypothetical protein